MQPASLGVAVPPALAQPTRYFSPVLHSNVTECVVHSLQFTVYSLQLTVYSLQFTVYGLQFTVLHFYSFIVLTVFAVYSLQFTVYTYQFTAHGLRFTVHGFPVTGYIF